MITDEFLQALVQYNGRIKLSAATLVEMAEEIIRDRAEEIIWICEVDDCKVIATHALEADTTPHICMGHAGSDFVRVNSYCGYCGCKLAIELGDTEEHALGCQQLNF